MTGSDLIQDGMEQLRQFSSNSEKLELPIRLALFVSPLFLLTPKSLYKVKGRIDIGDVMQVCFREILCLAFKLNFLKDRNSLGKPETSGSPACRERAVDLSLSPCHS